MTVPTTWIKTTIGAIASVTAGGTPSRKKPEYWNGDVPWVSTSLIAFNTINETDELITRSGVDNSSAKVFPKGTLLMAMFGQGVTRGKVAMLGIDAAFNQACVAIVPKNGESSRFLFHNLSTRYDEIRRLSNAGSQENLNGALIKSLEIVLPEEKEIERIVVVADCWDRSISTISDLIAAKRQLKRGLMQQLLTGERRFPKFKKSADTHHTPCGRMPIDWRMCPLSRITEEVKRKNNKGVTRVLTASGVRGLVDQRRFFNRKVAGDALDKYYLLLNGEFAYNRSLMKGYPYGATKRLDDYDSGVLSTLYMCFRLLSDECLSDFLVAVFESGVLNSQLRGIARMGARAHGLLNVTADEFFDMVVPLPCRDEQRQIAAIIGAVDRELELLRKELDSYKSQKKRLMQKFLTGQVRVNV